MADYRFAPIRPASYERSPARPATSRPASKYRLASRSSRFMGCPLLVRTRRGKVETASIPLNWDAIGGIVIRRMRARIALLSEIGRRSP